MTLTSVINSIRQTLTDDGISAPFHIGPEHIPSHGSPPKIVWVPTSSSYEAPDRIGGVEQPIHTRLARSQIHVWGQSYEETEALVDAVIRALYKLFGGANYELSAGDWLEPPSATVKGRLYLLDVAIRLPVTLEESTTAKISRFSEVS